MTENDRSRAAKGPRPVPVRFDGLSEDDKLCFLVLAIRDFSSAAFAAEGASRLGRPHNQDPETYYALADAAVIRYARPFILSNLPCGTKSTRLEDSIVRTVAEVDPDKACKFHHWVLTQRAKVVAHSDLTDRGIGIGPVLDWFKNVRPDAVAPMITVLNLRPGHMKALANLSKRLSSMLTAELLEMVQRMHPKVFDGVRVWLSGAPPDALDVVVAHGPAFSKDAWPPT